MRQALQLVRQTARPTTQCHSAACRTVLARPFSVAPRRALKEGAEYSPEEIEHAKNEQKHKGNECEDRDKLRSQSESRIVADRQEVKDHAQHIKDLQRESAKKSEQEKR